MSTNSEIYTSDSIVSLVKTNPMDTVWGEHGTNFYLRTEVRPPAIVRYSGFEGKAAPQGLFTYDTSSGMLLLIVLLYSYLLFRAQSVARETWNLLFKKQRERSSIFEAEVTAPEIRFRLFVRILGVLGLAVYAYTLLAHFVPRADNLSALLLLAGLVVGIAFLLWIKYLILSFLAYVFFGSRKGLPLIQAYFMIIFCLGVFVLPFVALQTLVPEPFIPILQTFNITACIIAAFLLLYKIVQFFWINYYSILYIILYLCTLEILPVLVGIRVVGLFDISI